MKGPVADVGSMVGSIEGRDIRGPVADVGRAEEGRDIKGTVADVGEVKFCETGSGWLVEGPGSRLEMRVPTGSKRPEPEERVGSGAVLLLTGCASGAVD